MPAEGACPVLVGTAAGEDRTFQHTSEQRSVGAGVALRAVLLVVEGGEDRDVRQSGVGRRDRRQRGRGRVHGQQVVHARPGEQFVVAAQVGGALDGVGHQVPAGDLARGQPRLLLQEGDQIALAGVAESPDGLEVALLVELEPFAADGTVQVDGELRHTQQGAVDVDQTGRAVAQ